ncbi:AfsR/SARP family transcriptional regulator [Streptomyces sp. NRRL F-2580]|uniref:AfsR/SARP family transcriptional regulator n=1 Tax=Streptomyces sp. NRRL F-2580 TaxID=1463841 RepID=UPI00068B52BA|nr:AfsR/SARP family transcriptional regulator [Streptomyces sp. NRRL F-2580]
MRGVNPAVPRGGDGHRFRLLGPVRMVLRGAAVRPGPPRQQAVLAVLLLRRRRPVTVDELVAAVWGDDAPARAAGNLRTYAWGLRTLLEPGRGAREPARVLLGDGRGYVLHTAEDSVDVLRFEGQVEAARQARGRGDTAAEHALLADALGRWTGEALAGVPGPFAEEERVRLGALRAAARKRYFACALRLRLHHAVIPELTALTREFALDEELRALLMRALHGCGRQAEAFTVFADTHRILGEELGVAPCAELTALHARLLAHDPPPVAPDHRPPAPARAPAPPPAPPLLPPPPPSPEQEVLPEAAQRALAQAERLLTEGVDRGVVPVLTITGPGGAGKTELAARIADRVARRFPDGPLFVDLRTPGPVPAGPGPLLAHLLHALGIPPARIPADADQRAALYRSVLAGRRALVLLDGARDAAQVVPLLPGAPGNAVLVTTRSRALALPGAALIELAARPYAGEPSADEGADDPAASASGRDGLPPELARAARLLARHTTDLSVDAVAAVLDTGRESAARIAEALVDAGALDTPAAGSYRTPDRP